MFYCCLGMKNMNFSYRTKFHLFDFFFIITFFGVHIHTCTYEIKKIKKMGKNIIIVMNKVEKEREKEAKKKERRPRV